MAVRFISRAVYAAVAAAGFAFLAPGLRALAHDLGPMAVERPLRFPFAWVALAVALLLLAADLFARERATVARRGALLVTAALCAVLRSLPTPPAPAPDESLGRAMDSTLAILDAQWKMGGRYRAALTLPPRPSGYISRLVEVPVALVARADQPGPLLTPLAGDAPAVLVAVSPDGSTAWVTAQTPGAVLAGTRGPLVARAQRGVNSAPGRDALLFPYRR